MIMQRIAAQLAKRFREVILDGTWIANTNYKDQLSDTDWMMAATPRQDIPNTIAVLAQHIHYYISGVKNVLKGGTLDISDNYSFDFPRLQSQKEWDDFLTRFWKDAEEFAILVESMNDQKLSEFFVVEKYGTYQRNIEGMIEHSYYHLGQIVLLKKLTIVG